MVVGEPTLMGGEFGDEDERLITRLENNQFDSPSDVSEQKFSASPSWAQTEKKTPPASTAHQQPQSSKSEPDIKTE